MTFTCKMGYRVKRRYGLAGYGCCSRYLNEILASPEFRNENINTCRAIGRLSNRPFPRLDSDWAPADAAGGVLTLTLSNVCGPPLGNFRLAFTSPFPLVTDGGFEGARLLDRVCGFHVIAPPEGLVVTPGASWSTSIGLDWTLQHYTSALKSAYLILEHGSLLSVEPLSLARPKLGRGQIVPNECSSPRRPTRWCGSEPAPERLGLGRLELMHEAH
jgi:hypothetical protein